MAVLRGVSLCYAPTHHFGGFFSLAKKWVMYYYSARLDYCMSALKHKKLAVMGAGMVGGALINYLEKKHSNYVVYDPPKGFADTHVLNEAEVIFLCVPTPFNEGTRGFDLSFVHEAISVLQPGKTIVIKSTIVPGTTEKLQRQYEQHRICYNPEFLTEVTTEQDFAYPDRQIIGYTEQSYAVAKDIILLLPQAPFERIVPATAAEIIKYMGNTWFSTKVVFANQMYDFCQKMDVEYDTVKDAVAADKRIGPTHLEIFHSGYRGYGGKCLPKDTRALIELGDKLGQEFKLLKMVEYINNELRRQSELDKDR
jgi:UDPglucose 6-dehydrogenase